MLEKSQCVDKMKSDLFTLHNVKLFKLDISFSTIDLHSLLSYWIDRIANMSSCVTSRKIMLFNVTNLIEANMYKQMTIEKAIVRNLT